MRQGKKEKDMMLGLVGEDDQTCTGGELYTVKYCRGIDEGSHDYL